MAEEEKDQNEETEAAADEQEAPEAVEEQSAPEAEAPAEEAPADEPAAEEAAEEEPVAEEPAAEEAADEPASAPAAEAEAEAEPAERLSPKEIRRRKRSAFTGEASPELSTEERIERRAAERKRKAGERRRYRQGRGAARAKAEGKGSGTGTPAAEREPGNPKVRQGIVVSDKMDKTITVRVESARRHPAYEKVIRSSKMYHAHDERNEAGEGDTVRLVETRPMSKTKHWRLTEILEKAK
jgi:small subunit ribosomal protein S17